jgi:hypothetical protein
VSLNFLENGFGKLPATAALGGNGNTANPGSLAGPITQGPCGVVQNGGSNNVASPTCVPADRLLTDKQVADVATVFESLPDFVKVMVKTIDGNGETQRYAQQFQDIAVNAGRSGNPKAVILGMLWRPVPVGLMVATTTNTSPNVAFRDQLARVLSADGVQVESKVGDWIAADELYIVVGEHP